MQFGDNSTVHLLADADYVYTDNLFHRRTETKDDYMEFSPGFEIKLSRDAATTVSFRYQHRFTSFSKYSELDGDYSDLSGQIRYNSGRMLTSGYVQYEELASNSADVNLEGVLIERDEFDAGGRIKYDVSELTAIEVGVDYSEVDYDLAQFTDYDSFSIPITLFYRVRPKIDLTAGVRLREVDTSGTVDYDDTYYFIGAVGEFFSPMLFADIRIGFQDREFDGADFDTSSATYDITFIYTGDVKTTVYAGISRDYRTSAIGGGAYTYTSATLGARYSLNEVFGFNASIVVGESDYEQSPRAEDLTTFDAGVTYNPNDFLTIQAGYRSQDVSGKDPVFSSDYQTNTFRVSASVRY
ncbi:outer membrane beta-barrel protein [Puniceicoccales bacterium CK1056]|uniref:Outer membrane beta-barrel protein n=1 Tax=Oceanipulchritudo coccoides TaxID=2706888 RepID=A0A6B2LYY1_9BACT|nr:outer membrane beta-barrel protein [Oceanipulchritudo coccoides]NDV61144.1 outer membrane beta-barrel protein [Oceanipulchritudo coccoides]